MKKLAKGLCAICIISGGIVSVFTGCGKDDKDISSTKTLSEITSEIISSGINFPEMVEVTEDNFQFRYSIEADDYSEFSVYWAGSGGDADEICIIKAKSEDTLDNVEKAVESRMEGQKEVFDGYVAEEYDKLCNSEIKIKGQYVYWVCSEENGKANDIIESYLK